MHLTSLIYRPLLSGILFTVNDNSHLKFASANKLTMCIISVLTFEEYFVPRFKTGYLSNKRVEAEMAA